jgi:hypothetical protein
VSSFCYSEITACLQVSLVKDSEDATITVYLTIVSYLDHRLALSLKHGVSKTEEVLRCGKEREESHL